MAEWHSLPVLTLYLCNATDWAVSNKKWPVLTPIHLFIHYPTHLHFHHLSLQIIEWVHYWSTAHTHLHCISFVLKFFMCLVSLNWHPISAVPYRRQCLKIVQHIPSCQSDGIISDCLRLIEHNCCCPPEDSCKSVRLGEPEEAPPQKISVTDQCVSLVTRDSTSFFWNE